MQDLTHLEMQTDSNQFSLLFPSGIPDIPDLPPLSPRELLKAEPDLDDLDDLDKLLTDSIAIAKKAANKRIYKELKKAVDEKILCDFQLERWELLDNIEVWLQTKCKCGEHGEPTFLRYMQKMKKVGSSLIHWKEVKGLEKGEEVRYALMTTGVQGCLKCRGKEVGKFEEFKQVIK